MVKIMKTNTRMPFPVKSFYSIFFKRFLDIILSGLALIILTPLLILTCILELVFHGTPIFYATKRPGKSAKTIKIYKFRSMTNDRGKDGVLLPEKDRVTNFGLFLRKTSIDEIPELWSILKGDMSIIGPRPLLIEYLDLYTPRHAMRHSVRPGLVCPNLKEKRENVRTWREQFENDIYYIEHISFLTDVKMIFAAVRDVFRGAEFRVNDTRVPFMGNNLDDTRRKYEMKEVIHFDSISL